MPLAASSPQMPELLPTRLSQAQSLRLRVEGLLRQAQKTEAYGRLTGAIAA